MSGSKFQDIDIQCDINECRIILIEDKTYSKDNVISYLRRIVDEKTTSFIMNYIENLIDDLSNFARNYFKSIVRDIPLPKSDSRKFYLAEFPGIYSTQIISNGKSLKLVLEIKPKIGWDYFDKMIVDIQNNIKLTLPKIPVQRFSSILLTTHIFLIDDVLSYSSQVLKLTKALLTYPPRAKSEYVLISKEEIGKILIPPTIRLKAKGLPYVICRRVSTEIFSPPLIIAARLNKLLARDLDRLSKKFNEVGAKSLSEIIIDIKNSHLAILNEPLIKTATQFDKRIKMNRDVLIEKCKKHIRLNPYVDALIKLYLSYLSKKALLSKLDKKGFLNIVASCKVYELWVLSHILIFLKQRLKADVSLKKRGKYNLVFDLSNPSLRVEIKYNKPMKKGLIHDLIEEKVRPDIVITIGKSSIIVDAKYKDKLDSSDIYRLISYVVNSAEPIMIENNRILYGAISYFGEERESIRDLGDLKFKIKLCKVDPRDKDVSKGIECLIGELLRYIGV